MTNNVSGASSFEFSGNIGKIKTKKTQNSENGKASVTTEATKVSIFSSYDTDQSKHVSGEEMKSNNSAGYNQIKLNKEAAIQTAFKKLEGSAIKIANDKVNEMKDFGAKFDKMLTKFKSSKLFAKLSPEENQTSVSQAQITSATQRLDTQANSEFSNHATSVRAELADAMSNALAEIANEAEIEGQKQDIANASIKDNPVKTTPQDGAEQTTKAGTEQPQTVDGQEVKANEDVKKNETPKAETEQPQTVENQKVKAKEAPKDSEKPTFESLKAELGDAKNLPIAGSPKGYKAKAWNDMIKQHPNLKGKEIKNMITEANADAALRRYLKSMET